MRAMMCLPTDDEKVAGALLHQQQQHCRRRHERIKQQCQRSTASLGSSSYALGCLVSSLLVTTSYGFRVVATPMRMGIKSSPSSSSSSSRRHYLQRGSEATITTTTQRQRRTLSASSSPSSEGVVSAAASPFSVNNSTTMSSSSLPEALLLDSPLLDRYYYHDMQHHHHHHHHHEEEHDYDRISSVVETHLRLMERQGGKSLVIPSSILDETTIMTPAAVAAVVEAKQQQQQQQLTQQQNLITQARLLLLGASALYGTNFSIVKLMGDDLPTGLGSMLRFGLAALAASPWLLPSSGSSSSSAAVDDEQGDDSRGAQIGAIVAGLEVGLWNSIGYVAQAVGLETTPASNSAFLCSLAVVIVPILDYWFAGKRLLPKQMTGVLLAIFGVGLLELSDVSSTADLLDLLSPGDVASLFQPVAFGIGFWRMERAMQRFPQQAHRSTAAQLLAVFLGSAMYCLFVEQQPAAYDTTSLVSSSLTTTLQDPMIWLMLVWTGVITTALTVYMETVALKSLSAAETTLIFSAEPVFGSAFAAMLLGERFGLDAFAGAFLILCGCIVSNLGLDGMIQTVFGSSSSKSSSLSADSAAGVHLDDPSPSSSSSRLLQNGMETNQAASANHKNYSDVSP